MSFENPQSELVALCLADRSAFDRALARGVSAEMLADDDRAIFAAMVEAEREKRGTDAPSLALSLPKLRDKIMELRRSAHIGVNADYLIDEIIARIWLGNAALELNDLAQRVKRRRPFADLTVLKGEVCQGLDRLLGDADGSTMGPRTMAQVLDVELEKLEREVLESAEGKPIGIPTGILALDRLTSGGLKRGSVNVFAARTGVGKTTLALNLAHHAAHNGYAVCYFTVEMPAGQLARKLLSMLAAIKGRKMTTGDLTESEMDRLVVAVRELHKCPIWIDDSFRSSFEAFEYSCRRLKRQGQLDVIVVDYVQQLTVTGKHQSKQALVTEVSHRLKQLALDLDIAVISLAQFNREAEKDGGEPGIWQVKDSGAIEQDADLGVCLYRDDQDRFWMKVDKNRWGQSRFKFLIDADLSMNVFRNASINLPEDL